MSSRGGRVLFGGAGRSVFSLEMAAWYEQPAVQHVQHVHSVVGVAYPFQPDMPISIMGHLAELVSWFQMGGID